MGKTYPNNPMRTILIPALALILAACQIQEQEAPSATLIDPEVREVFTGIVGWIVLGVEAGGVAVIAGGNHRSLAVATW